MEGEKLRCPRCGSELVVEISNQKHCNACGHDFAIERDPIGRRAQQARSDSTGYGPRPSGKVSAKESVFVATFGGFERESWLCPQLNEWLLRAMLIEPKVRGFRTKHFRFGLIDINRNRAAQEFLASDFSWLLMCDNDQCPPDGLLGLIDNAPVDAHVIAPRTWVLLSPEGELKISAAWRVLPGVTGPDGHGWLPLHMTGSGCVAIRRACFARLTPPFFRFTRSADGLSLLEGEDEYFCRRVREAGGKIYGNAFHEAAHFHTLDLACLMRWVDGHCANTESLCEKPRFLKS